MLTLSPELFDELNARQWVGNMRPAVYGKRDLDETEIARLREQLGFNLPRDFVTFLRHVTDPGEVLFDYWNFQRKDFDDVTNRVFDNLILDVENDDLWLKRWGKRPAKLSDAQNLARQDFASWPKLLPIYGHRFLAAEPFRENNPVYSIFFDDIVYYGANLAHYLVSEFIDHDHEKHTYAQRIQRVGIWSDFVERDPAVISTKYSPGTFNF